MAPPTPGAVPPIRLPGGRTVPEHAVAERATSSGGPGGQHANRSATRIVVSVLVNELPLSDAEMERLRGALGSRLTADGFLSAASRSTRSQLQNRRLARRALEALLAEALAVDPPRARAKVPRGQRLRRLADKRHRGGVKRTRRGPDAADDG